MKKVMFVVGLMLASSSAFAAGRCEGNAKAYAQAILKFEYGSSVSLSSTASLKQARGSVEVYQVVVTPQGHGNFAMTVALASDHCQMISISRKAE